MPGKGLSGPLSTSASVPAAPTAAPTAPGIFPRWTFPTTEGCRLFALSVRPGFGDKPGCGRIVVRSLSWFDPEPGTKIDPSGEPVGPGGGPHEYQGKSLD
jgi:hypothetical protein